MGVDGVAELGDIVGEDWSDTGEEIDAELDTATDCVGSELEFEVELFEGKSMHRKVTLGSIYTPRIPYRQCSSHTAPDSCADEE